MLRNLILSVLLTSVCPSLLVTALPVYAAQEIGLAKAVTDIEPLGGTLFDVTFVITIDNLSPVDDATNLQLIEDYRATFAPAASFEHLRKIPRGIASDGNFDGDTQIELLNGDGTFPAGASATITLIVRVDTGGFEGPYSNQVSGSTAASFGGVPIATDLSDDGFDTANGEDDPTIFFLRHQQIAVAKTVDAVRSLGNEQFEVDFRIVVSNPSSSVAATNVQITDDLAAAFPGAGIAVLSGPSVSGGLGATNPAYDGVADQNLLAGTEDLAPGASAEVHFTVQLDLSSSSGPYANSATAFSQSDDGTVLATDDSDSGVDPQGPNKGEPGDTGGSDDPTPVPLPAFELTKTLAPPVQIGGPVFDLTFTVMMRNTGDVELTGIRLTDDLASLLSPTTLVGIREITQSGFTGAANDGFDGRNDIELLLPGAALPVGATGTVVFTARIDISTGPPGEPNRVFAFTDQTDGGTPSEDPTPIDLEDSDGDGAPDSTESDTDDRDGDGRPDAMDLDPTGYFYCEDDGRILPGGFVSITGPNGTASGVGTSNGITIARDGSDGSYQFWTDDTPGTYTLNITYPGSGLPSVDRLPEPGSLDVTSILPDNPAILGSGEVGDTGVLADFSAAANTPFYTRFDMEPGDPPIFSNNLPLTGCVADAQSLVIGKTVDTESVMVGDLVAYTLMIRNAEAFPLGDVVVEDFPPAGFTYVEGSAQLMRGAVVTPVLASGTRPVRFQIGALGAGEEVRVSYLLRVGAGVVSGVYRNRAGVLVGGDPASNVAEASVTVRDDPLVNETRVVGKVFHDRDGDGWQDNADATGVRLSGGPFTTIRHVGPLPGRASDAGDGAAHRAAIDLPGAWTTGAIELRTRQGTLLLLHPDGRVDEKLRGQVRRGASGQRLTIERQDSQIVVTNHGLHEEGLPGVRLATVTGLIIETDAFGRYHLEAIDGVNWDTGSNFILKVDATSLPKGSHFTTPNPRVERLTQGLMSDLDFGVALPSGARFVPLEPEYEMQPVTREREVTRTITKQLDEVYFESGRHAVSVDQEARLRTALEPVLGNTLLTVNSIGHADSQKLKPHLVKIYGDNQGLSESRAEEVAGIIANELQIPRERVAMAGMSDRQPVASNRNDAGRALNRRVEVDLVYETSVQEVTTALDPVEVSPGSKPLPHAGVVRAVNDQRTQDPRLAVLAAPRTARSGTRDVRFHVYTNYPAFIAQMEVRVFASHDTDRVRPLAVLPFEPVHALDVMHEVVWQADLSPGTLQYVVRATGRDGRVDETAVKTLTVLHEAVAPDLRNAPVDPWAEIFARDDLAQQTIALRGGRLRVFGHGMDAGYEVLVGGETVRPGAGGAFVLETHMPAGAYAIPVVLRSEDGQEMRRELSVEVDDHYVFMVGLANVTYGGTDIDGSIEPLSGDDRYDDDTYVTGRLAFYLKGKIQGKYLVTAQLDSTEDDLGEFTDNIKRKDPTSIFRRLEPDRYYPVYGDDSNVRADTDSQGAFYVRIDWDKSKALWGNFETGLTGNEFAQYNRSLYGAQLVYRLPSYTKYAQSRLQFDAFVSEPQTAAGHNEFLATGGSLYYLNRTDIVRGSEKVWIEVRRRDTEQVVELIALQPGEDYQFDHIQGRIILNRPLTQVSRDHYATIIRDAPLEGDDVYLVTDFEYVPRGFSEDDTTAGGRVHGWVTNWLGVGGTYVQENRAGADYELKGGDVTLRAGQGTYLKLEAAQSDAVLSAAFFSADGGLNFAPQKVPGTDMSGDAYGVEARLGLADVSDVLEGSARAWFKHRDAGFSSSREAQGGADTRDYGVEFSARLNDRLQFVGQAKHLERDGVMERDVIGLQSGVQITDRLAAALEVRHERVDDLLSVGGGASVGGDTRATLVGARIDYAVNERTKVYAEGQTVADSDGDYEDNDLVTFGFYGRVSGTLGAGLEVSTGDRGDALVANVDVALNDSLNLDFATGIGSGAHSNAGFALNLDDGQQIYGSFGVDPDSILGRDRRVTTLGQRRRYGNGVMLYNEHQWIDARDENGATRTFGIDYDLANGWLARLSLQTGELEREGVDFERRAATIGLGYEARADRVGVTMQIREDDAGSADYLQWLTTASWMHEVNDALRTHVKLNYSETEDRVANAHAARFMESSLGFAFRPVRHDRWNVLGRYTYLYDLVAPGQIDNRPDQRSHVLSVEALYDWTRRVQFGAKVALRRGEVRMARDRGDWFENGVNLYVGRARYRVVKAWDLMAEYRYLETVEVDDARSGWLVGAYRHLGDRLKIGVGYNFTDYSDDLTDQDYDARGWFIDAVGKW